MEPISETEKAASHSLAVQQSWRLLYTNRSREQKSHLECSWPETDIHGETLLDTRGRKRQCHDDEDVSTPAY